MSEPCSGCEEVAQLRRIAADCDCPSAACAGVRAKFHIAVKDMQNAQLALQELRTAYNNERGLALVQGLKAQIVSLEEMIDKKRIRIMELDRSLDTMHVRASAAESLLSEWRESYEQTIREKCDQAKDDRVHCTCVPDLRRYIKNLEVLRTAAINLADQTGWSDALKRAVADTSPMCHRDTDGDGNCHVHPSGCPKPCLDPEKMHGAGDGFPGNDFP